MIESKAFALALSFGALGGGMVAALLYYWLWNMRPSKFETELIRSDIKDIRADIYALHGKCQNVADRMDAIEHPPFEPKFGDMVMAEKADKSGMKRAVYMYTSNGEHRVAMVVDDVVNEYFTDTIEPLEND